MSRCIPVIETIDIEIGVDQVTNISAAIGHRSLSLFCHHMIDIALPAPT